MEHKSCAAQTSLSLPLDHPRAKLHPQVQLLHQPVAWLPQVGVAVQGGAHVVEQVACGSDVERDEDKAPAFPPSLPTVLLEQER